MGGSARALASNVNDSEAGIVFGCVWRPVSEGLSRGTHRSSAVDAASGAGAAGPAVARSPGEFLAASQIEHIGRGKPVGLSRAAKGHDIVNVVVNLRNRSHVRARGMKVVCEGCESVFRRGR